MNVVELDKYQDMFSPYECVLCVYVCTGMKGGRVRCKLKAGYVEVEEHLTLGWVHTDCLTQVWQAMGRVTLCFHPLRAVLSTLTLNMITHTVEFRAATLLSFVLYVSCFLSLSLPFLPSLDCLNIF